MRILFATDGSPGSDVALDLLCSLRLQRDDHVEVLCVPVHHYSGADMSPAYVSDLVEQEMADAKAIGQEAAMRLGRCGTDATARDAEGSPAEAIIRVAAATRSDLIVLGSRGHGLIAGALLGSTSRALARHSPIPVLVVRDRRDAPRRIVAAIDGSEDSRLALKTLAAIPLPRGAEIVLLHVIQDRGGRGGTARMTEEMAQLIEREDRVRARDLLHRAAGQIPSSVSTRVEISDGAPAERILTIANATGADLVVLGSRGTTLGTGFLQGSTADRVLSGAHCAVLVARAAERVEVGERVSGPIRELAAL